MEDSKTIHYLEIPNGYSKVFIHYDNDRGVVECQGHECVISIDKLADFLHMAKLIGLKSGEI